MKKILLVCSAGMSTSLLVTKMKEAAKQMGEEIEIQALPIAECSSVINEVDIVPVSYTHLDVYKRQEQNYL